MWDEAYSYFCYIRRLLHLWFAMTGWPAHHFFLNYCQLSGGGEYVFLYVIEGNIMS